MIIDLSQLIQYSNMVNNDYSGSFETCDFTGGNKDCGTNTLLQALNRETIYRNMNNQKYLKILNSLLETTFGNDIQLFAKNMNIPADEIEQILSGKASPTRELVMELERAHKECVQIGDKVAGDKIVVSGDMNTHNYGITSLEEENKRLKIELADLRKLAKSKDYAIEALKETIELLKKK